MLPLFDLEGGQIFQKADTIAVHGSVDIFIADHRVSLLAVACLPAEFILALEWMLTLAQILKVMMVILSLYNFLRARV